MAKIHAMMDIGKRSMMNSQTSLQTTAHNIANKTTEGFSRQRVDVVTNTPVGEGRLLLGMGAKPAQISRVVNPAIDKQIQKEAGTMGYLESRSAMLERVQEVFNEQQNKGLNQYMTDFFNGFRELSNNPESLTTRTIVKDAAEALTNDFKRVMGQLNDIQRDVNQQVKIHCVEVNKMTKEVADLNKQIMEIEIQGNPANDYRDRRELLLKKINDRVEISWAEGDHGMVNVSTAGNALLVSGLDNYDLQAHSDSKEDKVDVYYTQREGNIPFKVSDRIKNGQLGGALSVRDHVIEDIKNKMDELATTIAHEVNAAHVNGLDRQGRKGELFFDLEDPDNDIKRVSEMLMVSKNIQNDVTRIAAGSHEAAPGDNTVAHVISNVQYKTMMDNGTATLDDYYASQVGQIGTFTQSTMKGRDSQANVMKQLNTIRDSVSGVSLDEEAVKMIEYQKAFDASARVIRTADEMFDTILNLKRM